MDKRIEEIYGYLSNLPFFPDGYFEEHTAKELNISEEGRQMLVKMQSDKENAYDWLNKEICT